MSRKNQRYSSGRLVDCQADLERMSTEHLRSLFNTLPPAVLQRRISDIPDKEMRAAVRLAVRQVTAT